MLSKTVQLWLSRITVGIGVLGMSLCATWLAALFYLGSTDEQFSGTNQMFSNFASTAIYFISSLALTLIGCCLEHLLKIR